MLAATVLCAVLAVVLVQTVAGAQDAGPAGEGKPPLGPPEKRLIIGYERDASKSSIESKAESRIAARAKVEVGRSFPAIDAEVITVEGSVEEEAKALEKQPGVRYVERDRQVRAAYLPNDPEFRARRQYEIYQQSFDVAWNTARGIDRTTGRGIRVAVIDGGCDRTHPDLDGKIVKSYDFANRDPYAWDDTGHGTFVAGLIGAETNNRAGIAASGFHARILCAKAANNDIMWNSDAVAAMSWARTNGARVVNISFAAPPRYYSQAYADMARSLWNSGINVVAAAGNTGRYESGMYPASYYGVTGVGAVTVYDRRASFSSYGPHVDVSAMGANARSTRKGGGYMDWSGTSFATPQVAGLMALIKAKHNTGSDATRSRIQNTALDLGPAGRDNYYGFGRIRAAASVR